MTPLIPKEALRLWEEGHYWEVHEALEPLWMGFSGHDRELLQGVILLAAALHKAKTNPRGGWRNFNKARKHLEWIPEQYKGVWVAELLQEVKQALEVPGYLPRFPLQSP